MEKSVFMVQGQNTTVVQYEFRLLRPPQTDSWPIKL